MLGCISIWLVSSQKPLKNPHAAAGENPELRILFHRLVQIASLPIAPIFVFDGPHRPAKGEDALSFCKGRSKRHLDALKRGRSTRMGSQLTSA